MVRQMYELIKEWKVTQPITFPVRASLMAHSVPQLKWLTEMTAATITLWMGEADPLTISHMAYVRSKFDKDQIYYDLKDDFIKEFDKVKEDSESHIASEFKHADRLSFKPAYWNIFDSGDEKVVEMGSESVLIKNGMLITKEEYKASSFSPVTIKGQAELLDVSGILDSNVGFEIYLRVDKSTSSSNISGVKCFIGANGKLNIASSNIKGLNSFGHTILKVNPGCIQFTITDAGDKITLHVEVLDGCVSVNTNVLARDTVHLSMRDVKSNSYHIALKTSDSNTHVAIPQFHVET